MTIETQNQASDSRRAGIYFACGICGRWQRSSHLSGELKCKSCGSLEKLPGTALDGRTSPSHFDPGLRQANLRIPNGRFWFICPYCKKKYEFPMSMDGQAVLCQKCRKAFKAKSYIEDQGPDPAKRSGEARPTKIEGPSPGPALAPGRVEGHQKICAYDHMPIDDDDEWISCPECGLPYHKECWEENFGCAAFGCPQVGALKPREEGPPPLPVEPAPGPLPPPVPGRLPWEFLLLGGSAVALLPGLITFGAPSLILCGVSIFLIARKKSGTQYVWLVLSLFLSFITFWGGFLSTLYLLAD